MRPATIIPPVLCFAVPLAGAFLLRRSNWLPLLSYSTLAAAAGVLGLTNQAGLFSISKALLVVQAALYAELGASVIFLAKRYSAPVPWLPPRKAVRPYTIFLSVFLACATLLGLITPFVLAIPPIMSPLVFLVYTLSTFPLLAHLLHNPVITTPSRLKKKNPKLKVVTVLIPPPLPSPASSSTSFPSKPSPTKYIQTHSSCPTDLEISPPTSIRQRARSIHIRSRNVLSIVALSQLLACLSGALLLILGYADRTADHDLLRIIETAMIVLAVCGFMFAFYLHGSPLIEHETPNPGKISISVSIAQQQDIAKGLGASSLEEVEVEADHMVHCRDNTQTGLGFRLPKFKIFNADRKLEQATQLKLLPTARLSHHHHRRFASASSSFLSPEDIDTTISHPDEQEKVVEDEGIDLPVLSNTNQLPSPPDTPRTHIPSDRWSDALADEPIRIGIATPELKPSVVTEFTSPHQHPYAEGIQGEVIDTAVSEPGHSSSSYHHQQQWYYGPRTIDEEDWRTTVTTQMTGSPELVPRSSNWGGLTLQKPPKKKRSTMSLTFSIGRKSTRSPEIVQIGGGEVGGGTSLKRFGSGWTRADKLKGKLGMKRLEDHKRSMSMSQAQSRAEYSAIAPSYPPTPHIETDNGAHGYMKTHHKTVSSPPSPYLGKFSAPSSPILGSVGEWYPFTSKTRLKESTRDQLRGRPISTKQKNHGKSAVGREGNSNKEEAKVEMADFVDLTDPFASPTPGFALPKWVGSASGGGAGTDSQIGQSGGTTSSWSGCERQGDELMRSTRSRSSEWGSIPPMPPLPSELQGLQRASVSGRESPTKERKKLRRIQRRRPDSPMPMTRTVTTTSTTSRSLKLRGRVSKESLRTGSPVQSLSRVPLAILRTEGGSGVVEENGSGEGDIFSPMSVGLRRKAPGQLPRENAGASRSLSGKRRMRNGSPVPIPFGRPLALVSKSIGADSNSSGSGSIMRNSEESRESANEVDLPVEEALLAQRLLRSLVHAQDLKGSPSSYDRS